MSKLTVCKAHRMQRCKRRLRPRRLQRTRALPVYIFVFVHLAVTRRALLVQELRLQSVCWPVKVFESAESRMSLPFRMMGPVGLAADGVGESNPQRSFLLRRMLFRFARF